MGLAHGEFPKAVTPISPGHHQDAPSPECQCGCWSRGERPRQWSSVKTCPALSTTAQVSSQLARDVKTMLNVGPASRWANRKPALTQCCLLFVGQAVHIHQLSAYFISATIFIFKLLSVSGLKLLHLQWKNVSKDYERHNVCPNNTVGYQLLQRGDRP